MAVGSHEVSSYPNIPVFCSLDPFPFLGVAACSYALREKMASPNVKLDLISALRA